ncbi:MAG TPA: hypothetical protein VFT53_00310 [Candidatus Saccharimonadales bacterium]|nr:hypothetical protein [Candidatus Saccharimonadales bacterium]
MTTQSKGLVPQRSLLSAATHSDAQEVENLIKLTEDALYYLLK